MARQGFSSCAINTTPPAKNTAGILREAMKLPAKDHNLMLQVFLIVLSPFSFLVLLHYIIAGPLIQQIEETYEEDSYILDPKDVRNLIAIEIPFFIAFLLISLFGMFVTIHASALTYINNSTSLEELGIWIVSNCKKQLITSTNVIFVSLAYISLSIVSLQLISLIGGKDASFICSWVGGILALSIYLYLASVLILGLVISVVEEDCYGSKALQKSLNLIKGRRIQGFFLMLILSVLSIPIYVVFYVTTTDDDSELGPAARLGFIFIATVLFCLTNFFTFMVFTVFHFECRRAQVGSLETEFGAGYVSVSTVVDP